MFGGTVDYVLEHAPCEVLVNLVPREYPTEGFVEHEAALNVIARARRRIRRRAGKGGRRAGGRWSADHRRAGTGAGESAAVDQRRHVTGRRSGAEKTMRGDNHVRGHRRLRPGRFGLARDLVAEGHEVAVIDENPDSFELLGDDFPGQFVIGRGDRLGDAAGRPGSTTPTPSSSATDGDNTNIIVAQIAKRALRRARAPWRVCTTRCAPSSSRPAGIRTVCPTKDAKDLLLEAVNSCQLPGRER